MHVDCLLHVTEGTKINLLSTSWMGEYCLINSSNFSYSHSIKEQMKVDFCFIYSFTQICTALIARNFNEHHTCMYKHSVDLEQGGQSSFFQFKSEGRHFMECMDIFL